VSEGYKTSAIAWCATLIGRGRPAPRTGNGTHSVLLHALASEYNVDSNAIILSQICNSRLIDITSDTISADICLLRSKHSSELGKSLQTAAPRIFKSSYVQTQPNRANSHKVFRTVTLDKWLLSGWLCGAVVFSSVFAM